MKCPPFANQMSERMKARGKYAEGWPKGAIVHFTAGRDGAEKTIRGGIKNGYTFWCIEKDGDLYCAHSAEQWGYHAGESRWDKVKRPLVGSVSDDLIGIEINAAGRCTKVTDDSFKTWFATYLKRSEVRYSEGVANQERGYYEKFTEAQEKTLVKTLFWLKDQAPNIFSFDYVLGHDEVSPGRKNDPGAALSMTMPAFREYLKAEYAKIRGPNV